LLARAGNTVGSIDLLKKGLLIAPYEQSFMRTWQSANYRSEKLPKV